MKKKGIKAILYTVLTAVICGGLYIFTMYTLPRLLLQFMMWLSNDGV